MKRPSNYLIYYYDDYFKCDVYQETDSEDIALEQRALRGVGTYIYKLMEARGE